MQDSGSNHNAVPKLYLAQNLKYLRRKYKLSQESLAKSLGISRNKIASYESRNIEPRLDLISAMANMFNIQIDDLIKTAISDENLNQLQDKLPPKDSNSLDIVIDGNFKDSFETFIHFNDKFDKIINGFKAYRDLRSDASVYSTDNKQLIDVLDHLMKANKNLIMEVKTVLNQ